MKDIFFIQFAFDSEQCIIFDSAFDILRSKNNIKWLVPNLSNLPTTDKRRRNRLFYFCFKIYLKLNYSRYQVSNLLIQTLDMHQTKEGHFSKKNAFEAARIEFISRYRDTSLCVNHDKDLLLSLEQSYILTFNFFFEYFEKNTPDKIYLYNGRFLHERAIWDVASSLKIDVGFLERITLNKDRFWVFENPVHDPIYRGNLIEENWKAISNLRQKNEYEFEAKEWFEKRKNGETQHFTRNQDVSFNKLERKIITFFHSSEDEIIGKGLVNEEWHDQTVTILKTFRLCEKLFPEHDFVLRIHPNLIYKSVREIRKWTWFELYLKNLGAIVYSAENPINSYSLLESSEIVFSFGSTIGIEAAYYGKYSILVGSSLNSATSACKKVNSVKELEILLNNLSSIDGNLQKLGAIKFALFEIYGGVPIKLQSHETTNGSKVLNISFFLFLNKLSILFNRIESLLSRSFIEDKGGSCDCWLNSSSWWQQGY